MFTSNASVKSASNNTISTPKFFRFNLFNDTIEGSEFNFKKAGDPTSAQYAELMQFKAIQPSFKFAPIASAKKVEKKADQAKTKAAATKTKAAATKTKAAATKTKAKAAAAKAEEEA